jgi:hypothetical protein
MSTKPSIVFAHGLWADGTLQEEGDDLERHGAKRMGARTCDVDTSQIRMLSNPKFVVEVIRDVIEAV